MSSHQARQLKKSIRSKSRNLMKLMNIKSRVCKKSWAKKFMKPKRSSQLTRPPKKRFRLSCLWRRRDTKISKNNSNNHMPSLSHCTRPWAISFLLLKKITTRSTRKNNNILYSESSSCKLKYKKPKRGQEESWKSHRAAHKKR